MKKKFIGFTLGEILIALAVVGVIALLVLPQMIAGQKAAQGKSQFETAYSLIAKSIADMDADNVSILPATYKTEGTFYEVFKHYHRVIIDCGIYQSTNDSVCLSISNYDASNYKRLDGTPLGAEEKTLMDDGAFVINNNMLIMIEQPYNSQFYGLLIWVDINGKNKLPNQLGYDVFAFELTQRGELLPVGAEGTGQTNMAAQKWGSSDPQEYCDPDSNKEFNGITCAYFATTNEDYFQELYKGH